MIQNNPLFIPIKQNLLLTKNLWLITMPLYLIGAFAGYMFFAEFEIYKLVMFVLGYFFFNVIGITAGFHRYFSHKSFRVSKWKERLMMVAGTLAAQGPVIYWVALHRGYHHRHSDTYEDPHSPIHGVWHSFILWMFRLGPDSISLKSSVDLLRNQEAMWLSKNYGKVVLGFWILCAFISIDLFLFGVMLPSLVSLLTYNTTNTVTHMRSMGYTNFTTKDQSTNIPWLWPLVLGECWHNNHHAKPGTYHYGSGTSGKWWELDPSGAFIKVFKDGDR